MTIRRGVEWSNGDAFTAKDVVFTFDLLKKFPAMDVKGAWQHIDTIEQQGGPRRLPPEVRGRPEPDDHRPDVHTRRAALGGRWRTRRRGGTRTPSAPARSSSATTPTSSTRWTRTVGTGRPTRSRSSTSSCRRRTRSSTP
ncbi:ABC transporter substrate-binding protein [Curtobacterium sp. MCPF17_052]|uniref:ABC transporter substrate-binding protein n=1 Tax=Curtobacterium sp. MCPF17_052 TaxID=2175655 RepID=UPI003463C43F